MRICVTWAYTQSDIICAIWTDHNLLYSGCWPLFFSFFFCFFVLIQFGYCLSMRIRNQDEYAIFGNGNKLCCLRLIGRERFIATDDNLL